ncbi:MAG: hypothetical protein ACRDOM_03065 [Nocardioides sp.]
MGRQQPAAVTNAIAAQMALIGVSGLTTLVTAFQREELVAAWTARQPEGITPPAFVPVAIVLFVTYALLAAVLVAFFRGGHPSARLSLTVLAAFFLFTMLVIYRQDPPTLFVVLAAISAVLDLVLIFFLWHKETGAFLRGAGIAAQRAPERG